MKTEANRLQLNKEYLLRLARMFGYTYENEKSMMFVCGRIASDVIEFRKDAGQYLKFMIECERMSGALDMVQVVIDEELAKSLKNAPARTEITMLGSLVSEDWSEPDGTHHLDIFMKAGHFEFGSVGVEDDFDRNIVVIDGHVCKDPNIKVTDKHRRTITEVSLSVNNNEDGAYCFPLIMWGKKAWHVYQYNKRGDRLKLTGRIQSRVFNKDGALGMAFEVSTSYTVHIKKGYEKNAT